MQLYDGMPVITNKVTPAEQRGVPHHLLGSISLDATPWDVEDFRREATKVIGEIRGRGNLPILVGGTHYYIEPLLFKDVILDDVHMDSSKSFPILEQSTEVMLQELRRVDPIMAEKWHPNDRRKIQRSLEIYLHTGRPASEFYAEQRERKQAALKDMAEGETWEKLLFWVYSERDTLVERLDRRVDKMMDTGLLNEVQELFELKRKKAASGQIVDMTKGIWQSIGYKEFEPYLTAVDEAKDSATVAALKSKAVIDVQSATRRYANHQTRWIRLKQIPLINAQGPAAVQSFYLLDSTDVSQFQTNVVTPAAELTDNFLHGRERIPPMELSDVARDVLTRVSDPPPKPAPVKRKCEVCQTVAVTEGEWQKHVQGRNHKRALRKRQKLALVPVDNPVRDKNRAESDSGRSEGDSVPDLASMFST